MAAQLGAMDRMAMSRTPSSTRALDHRFTAFGFWCCVLFLARGHRGRRRAGGGNAAKQLSWQLQNWLSGSLAIHHSPLPATNPPQSRTRDTRVHTLHTIRDILQHIANVITLQLNQSVLRKIRRGTTFFTRLRGAHP
eukprot:scaffold14251_cov114-Isochrysis_galbana.AAC.5